MATTDTTATTTALVDRYIDVWNTTGAEQRARLIADTWVEDGDYLDPVLQARGHNEIDAMIGEFQAQYPGIRFHRAAAIDTHHDRVES